MIKRQHTVVGQKKLHKAPLLFLFSASDIRETWQLAEETLLSVSVHVVTTQTFTVYPRLQSSTSLYD